MAVQIGQIGSAPGASNLMLAPSTSDVETEEQKKKRLMAIQASKSTDTPGASALLGGGYTSALGG
jgi:hypothetical protein